MAVVKEKQGCKYIPIIRDSKMFSVVFVYENGKRIFHKMSLSRNVKYHDNIQSIKIDCFHYRFELDIIKSHLMYSSKHDKQLGKIAAIEIRDWETNSILLRKYNIINLSPFKYKCVFKYRK